jgi:hypothetical protein
MVGLCWTYGTKHLQQVATILIGGSCERRVRILDMFCSFKNEKKVENRFNLQVCIVIHEIIQKRVYGPKMEQKGRLNLVKKSKKAGACELFFGGSSPFFRLFFW